MKTTESQRLLAEYLKGSETAFRELVSRYLNLVYSTAIRSVNGDAHLVEDVAQTVFADFSTKRQPKRTERGSVTRSSFAKSNARKRIGAS